MPAVLIYSNKLRASAFSFVQSRLDLGLNQGFGRITSTLTVILLFAGAFLLRLFELGERNFWLDEMTSLTLASRSPASILLGDGFDKHTPPFYYLLLHFWLYAAPKSEFGLRLLSATLDTVNVGLVCWAFRPEFGKRIAFIAACAWACSPFAIYFAQEARMYPLLAGLTLILYRLALDTEASRMSTARTALLSFVIIIGAYTHYYFLLAAASLTIGLFICARPRRKLAPWLLAALISFLCYIPWLGVLASLASSEGQTFRQHGLLVLPYTVLRFAVGYGIMPLSAHFKNSPGLTILANLPLLLVVFGIALVTGTACLRVIRNNLSHSFVLLLSAAFGPVILAILLSSFTSLMSERYFIVIYPFVLLLAVLGITSVEQRLTRSLLVSCCLGTTLLGLLGHYANPNFQFMAWRTAGTIVAEQNASSVPILVNEGFNRDVLKYYLPAEYQVVALSRQDTTSAENLRQTLKNTPIDSKVVLVQTLSAESARAPLQQLGWSLEKSIILPYENGLEVQSYRRSEFQSLGYRSLGQGQ